MKHKKIIKIGICLSLVGILSMNGTLLVSAAEVQSKESALAIDVQENVKEYEELIEEDLQESEVLVEESQSMEESELAQGKLSENNQNVFEISSNGTLIQYNGSDSKVVVPSNVKKIGMAFMANKNIKEVILPEGVTEIGEYAFYQCSNLEEVVLPSSVKKLGVRAFYACGNLRKINLSEGITEIPDEVFTNCSRLKEFTLPRSVKSIGRLAFYGCSEVFVTLPENLETLGDGAFLHCTSLTEITIPTSLKIIEEDVFSNTGVETVIIPENITEVGGRAFNGCKNLKYIEFPSGVKSLGDAVLNDNPSIQTVVFKGDAPILGNYMFLGIYHEFTIKVPSDAKGYDQEPWTDFNIVRVGGPKAVTNLKSVSAGKQKVKLTWNASEDAEGYLIYAQKNGKYGYCGMTTKGTTFTDKKALDTDYNFYWVFPYITDAETGKKIPGSCEKYVYAKGVIPAVTGLKASSVVGGVKLTWSKAVDAEGYLVYGQNNENSKYHYIGMTTKGMTFTDKKASKTNWNFYWVYPYYKDASGKTIVGGTAPYTYGRAR